MSRIGRLPITLPKDVDVKIDGTKVTVTGPKGTLEESFSPEIAVKLDNGVITVERPNDEPRIRALHGTTRALLHNMVVGCGQGFERELEIVGVGYRAEMNGKDLVLYVGYSHPVKFEAPEGISYETDAKTRIIKIKGRDRQQVGQIAANMRAVRPPEHYHGTGLRYKGEIIKLKAGKAGKTGK
jgi:large subunit ribosomal protein L6